MLAQLQKLNMSIQTAEVACYTPLPLACRQWQWAMALPATGSADEKQRCVKKFGITVRT